MKHFKLGSIILLILCWIEVGECLTCYNDKRIGDDLVAKTIGIAKGAEECYEKIKLLYPSPKAKALVVQFASDTCYALSNYTVTDSPGNKAYEFCEFPTYNPDLVLQGEYGPYCIEAFYDELPPDSFLEDLGEADNVAGCIDIVRSDKTKEYNAAFFVPVSKAFRVPKCLAYPNMMRKTVEDRHPPFPFFLCSIERSADTDMEVKDRLNSDQCLVRKTGSRGSGDVFPISEAVSTLAECITKVKAEYPQAMSVSFGHSNLCQGYSQAEFQSETSFLDDVVCTVATDEDNIDMLDIFVDVEPEESELQCPEFDRTDDIGIKSCESIKVKDHTRACENIFDGRLERNVKDGECFVSQSSRKGWVEVELEDVAEVGQVTILPKGNGGALPGAKVEVCMDNMDNCVECGVIDTVDKTKCHSLKCPAGIEGNMVRVSVEGSALAICEMKIYPN